MTLNSEKYLITKYLSNEGKPLQICNQSIRHSYLGEIRNEMIQCEHGFKYIKLLKVFIIPKLSNFGNLE